MKKRQLSVIFVLALFLLTGCSTTSMNKRRFSRTSLCPVHHVQMKEVPVIYGYPDEELLHKAERGEVILGGCIIKKEKTGYICPVDKKVYYRKGGRNEK